MTGCLEPRPRVVRMVRVGVARAAVSVFLRLIELAVGISRVILSPVEWASGLSRFLERVGVLRADFEGSAIDFLGVLSPLASASSSSLPTNSWLAPLWPSETISSTLTRTLPETTAALSVVSILDAIVAKIMLRASSAGDNISTEVHFVRSFHSPSACSSSSATSASSSASWAASQTIWVQPETTSGGRRATIGPATLLQGLDPRQISVCPSDNAQQLHGMWSSAIQTSQCF
ncbi:hypothetical protein M438DRAFT_392215 [Aureobasidium pullulans EXF-150]|uniref:Uncharacterized protein n=1 Tax=Aureobasidium pullulans EXF-150 TaxID=1043002 RepID=A0A074XHT8_AURPU|nr:uncharacterized protein M438DRAFT_392215 [Aureobasidium pullulans EXF-150]KEQ85065.1 hypothetical protein M438DRAFT_392215 [Aureobasidium pullulans EXF-150]